MDKGRKLVGLFLPWLVLGIIIPAVFIGYIANAHTPPLNTSSCDQYTPYYGSNPNPILYDNCVTPIEQAWQAALSHNQTIGTIWSVIFDLLLTVGFALSVWMFLKPPQLLSSKLDELVINHPRRAYLAWFGSLVVGLIFGVLGSVLASEFLFGTGSLLVFGFIELGVLRKKEEAAEPEVQTAPTEEEQKQYTEALQAVQHNPQSFEAWTELGWIQHKLDKNDDALASANKAISLNNTYARAWLVRGAALSTMEKKEGEALIALDEALRFDENNVDAMYYKGMVYTFQEHDTLAHHMFDKILARDPMYKDAFLGKAAIYVAKEDFDGLLVLAKEAIERFPDDAVGWRLQGQAYEAKGERIGAQGNTEMGYRLLDEAIASFNMALEIDPLHVPGYYLKAQPYVAIGEYGKALEILNQGLKIEPNNPLLQEAKADIVKTRTKETTAKIAGTAGRIALGGGIGLAKGSVGVGKILWNVFKDDMRKP